MKALDLFCGGGGATKGLQRAGFEVHGVDIESQPHYCGERFTQMNALDFPNLHEFDLIWASPPCQRYSMYSRNMGTANKHPDLIGPIRKRLEASGAPYIIENVVGSPLRNTTMLCGSMFGLAVVRHRLFETSFATGLTLSCKHTGLAIPVLGHGTPQWHRKRFGRTISIEEKRAAMGIDWMSRDELSEAIPPAYSEWIARQFLKVFRAA